MESVIDSNQRDRNVVPSVIGKFLKNLQFKCLINLPCKYDESDCKCDSVIEKVLAIKTCGQFHD